MTDRDINYVDRFGIPRYAGLRLTYDDVEGEAYEVLAIKSDICDSLLELRQLEGAMNIDKREGYAIYPIRDTFGHYLWFWKAKDLVLCLARGLWG
jgi:hypothetical protein